MALSPFDPQSISWMMSHDANSEGIVPMSFYLPDNRAGAFGNLMGQTSPGKNTAPTTHERHPGTPTIGHEIYHVGQSGR